LVDSYSETTDKEISVRSPKGTPTAALNICKEKEEQGTAQQARRPNRKG